MLSIPLDYCHKLYLYTYLYSKDVTLTWNVRLDRFIRCTDEGFVHVEALLDDISRPTFVAAINFIRSDVCATV